MIQQEGSKSTQHVHVYTNTTRNSLFVSNIELFKHIKNPKLYGVPERGSKNALIFH